MIGDVDFRAVASSTSNQEAAQPLVLSLIIFSPQFFWGAQFQWNQSTSTTTGHLQFSPSNRDIAIGFLPVSGMGIPSDDVVVIQKAKTPGEPCVITVNCPDKTGLGCDICRIILDFGLYIKKAGRQKCYISFGINYNLVINCVRVEL